MKIRNESKRTYFFNGGCIRPNEVCDIKDEAVAKALCINYPTEIICLDNLEARVVEVPKEPEESKEISLDEALAQAQKKPTKVKVKVK